MMEAFRKFLKCLHPLLLGSIVAALLANCFLDLHGGPCPSPFILVFAPISIGIGIGGLLSLWRMFVWFMDSRGERNKPS